MSASKLVSIPTVFNDNPRKYAKRVLRGGRWVRVPVFPTLGEQLVLARRNAILLEGGRI